MPDENSSKMKVVYMIVDRGTDKKPIWIRIGTAFVNRDSSINIKLDALPTNGTLHVRDYVPIERSLETVEAFIAKHGEACADEYRSNMLTTIRRIAEWVAFLQQNA